MSNQLKPENPYCFEGEGAILLTFKETLSLKIVDSRSTKKCQKLGVSKGGKRKCLAFKELSVKGCEVKVLNSQDYELKLMSVELIV